MRRYLHFFSLAIGALLIGLLSMNQGLTLSNDRHEVSPATIRVNRVRTVPQPSFLEEANSETTSQIDTHAASSAPSPLSPATTASQLAKCKPLGHQFHSFIDSYVAGLSEDQPRLMYNCESHRMGRFCGGMGDRFRGIISTFLIALVTGRRFQIYHPHPAPLESALRPHLFNWVPSDGPDLDKVLQVDTSLMRLKNHKSFFKWLATVSDNTSLRLQSNSFGIDPYLHSIPRFRTMMVEKAGLSSACNLTCYYGCLFDVLFSPTDRLQTGAERILSLSSQTSTRPYIGVQIRMGGSWAPGLVIKEPFRTPPSALPHFFSLVDELRNSDLFPQLKGCPLFVSSDSAKVIELFQKRYGNESVMFVPDAYNHTDTLRLGEAKPQKWKKLPEHEVNNAYFNTILAHYILGGAAHMVMAQSGFGDTAFWRSRTAASAIFVDMNNNRFAWQHALKYPPGAKSVVAWNNRIIDIESKPKMFYSGV